jgi:hypothetical protein
MGLVEPAELEDVDGAEDDDEDRDDDQGLHGREAPGRR